MGGMDFTNPLDTCSMYPMYPMYPMMGMGYNPYGMYGMGIPPVRSLARSPQKDTYVSQSHNESSKPMSDKTLAKWILGSGIGIAALSILASVLKKHPPAGTPAPTGLWTKIKNFFS